MTPNKIALALALLAFALPMGALAQDATETEDAAVAQQHGVGEARRDLLDVVGDQHRRRRHLVHREHGQRGDQVLAPAEVDRRPASGGIETMDDLKGMKARTRVVHAGRQPHDTHGVVNPPGSPRTVPGGLNYTYRIP